MRSQGLALSILRLQVVWRLGVHGQDAVSFLVVLVTEKQLKDMAQDIIYSP